MLYRNIHFLRQLAALLVAGSGVWQVATLWLAPLNEDSLLTALMGSVYLLISVGLFGHSRFTLFVAIAVPAAHLWLGMREQGMLPLTVTAAVDIAIIVLSARVLWALRNRPSL